AGRGLAGPLSSVDLDKFDDLLKLNVLAASKLMQQAAQTMLAMPAGSARDIVVLGSIAGKHISPFSAVYGATKFAVGSLAEALRRELAQKGIRVSLIAPAIVRSEFQENAGYDQEWEKNFAEKFGPLLSPDDIGRLVNFVVSQPPHVHINDVVIRPT